MYLPFFLPAVGTCLEQRMILDDRHHHTPTRSLAPGHNLFIPIIVFCHFLLGMVGTFFLLLFLFGLSLYGMNDYYKRTNGMEWTGPSLFLTFSFDYHDDRYETDGMEIGKTQG